MEAEHVQCFVVVICYAFYLQPPKALRSVSGARSIPVRDSYMYIDLPTKLMMPVPESGDQCSTLVPNSGNYYSMHVQFI